jgi:hypothetical protein
MICTTGFDHRGSWCFQDIGLNLKDGLHAARRASEIQLLGNPSSGEPNARRQMAVLDWLCNLSGPCALTARYEKPPGRGPERPEISRGSSTAKGGISYRVRRRQALPRSARYRLHPL